MAGEASRGEVGPREARTGLERYGRHGWFVRRGPAGLSGVWLSEARQARTGWIGTAARSRARLGEEAWQVC